MIRFILHRLLIFLLRLFVSGFLLLVLIEIGFGIFGGSDFHVWEISLNRHAPEALSSSGESWFELMKERSKNSLLVLGIAFGSTILIGYSWGILAARLRRFRVVRILVLPWSLVACLPGFWFVVVVAIYSFFQWKRPGFANDIFVETGPDLLSWWNAAVVAFPLIGLAVSWQVRAVAASIEREAAQPFVRALFLAGYRDDDIFYSNTLKRRIRDLVSLADRALPAILGGLIVVEWAFHFSGVASLLVDSVKASSYAGIFLSGWWMSILIGAAALIRECICHVLEKEE